MTEFLKAELKYQREKAENGQRNNSDNAKAVWRQWRQKKAHGIERQYPI